MREEQNKQKSILEPVLQQLINLATSYKQLVGHKSNENSGKEKGHLRPKGQSSQHLLFKRNGEIQARTLRLD